MNPRDLVLALKAAGLTQKQIGDATGIPQPTVSKIERGEVADVLSRNYRALLALYQQRVQAPPAPPAAAAATAAAAAAVLTTAAAAA